MKSPPVVKTPTEGIHFGKNVVHPSSMVPETCRIYAKALLVAHGGPIFHMILDLYKLVKISSVFFGKKIPKFSSVHSLLRFTC